MATGGLYGSSTSGAVVATSGVESSGLYGSSPTGALIAEPGAESSGLYGNTTSFGGTYFEWFIFQTSATQPATPTGGSWNFQTNVGTAPAGWTSAPAANPTNPVWISIAIVNSRSTTPLVWSTPGVLSYSGTINGAGAPTSGIGQIGELYIQTGVTPNALWFKTNSTTWTQITGSALFVDLTSNQTIGGVKTFSSTIQGSISGNAGTVTNGVYTDGSYVNPAWITSLAGSKITGDISGNAANVTGVVAVVNGGTGATTASGARTNLGLGTIATQDASSVAITGGSITGITDLAIADGGTGASTAAQARINLGLGTAAVLDAGVANGVATLDAGGTVPLSQIPASIQGGVSYQGTWNATTNTPTLTSSVGTKGYYYVVSTAGSTNLNGVTSWNIGDWAIFNGTAWEKIDNTDAVTSVNGYTGTVVLTQPDIAGTVPTTRTITAGTGLTGGGDLSADRTFAIDSTVATLTGTQTLTNKTLTSPVINQILDANGNEILNLSPVASATDYFTVRNGIGVGVPLHLQADGPSTNIGLHIQPKGSGLVTISDGTDFNKGIRFRSSSSAAGAVTLIDAVSSSGHVITLPNANTTLVGRDTTDTLTNKTLTSPVVNTPSITGGNIDNTVIGNTTPNAATFTTLTATGQTSLGGAAGAEGLRVVTTASGVNWMQISGSNSTGFSNLIGAEGSSSNIQMLYYTKGTNNHVFRTNGVGGPTQAVVSHTASAVNYVQVTGAATGGAPTISTQGSDTNASLILRSKGTFACEFQSSAGTILLQALPVASSVNFLRVSPAVASGAPVLSAQGSDTNIGLNLTTKGTGAVNLSTGNGIAFQATEYFLTGTTANYIFAAGRQASNPPVFGAAGSDTNISLAITSKGTGGIAFTTSNGAFNQLQVSHTASAVNFVQVTGAATGGGPTISSQGSDTNVDLLFATKGRGSFIFRTNTNVRQFQIQEVLSAVNFLQVGGAVAGAAPVLSAQGSDTNIPLVVQPKGTGALQAQLNDGTATGGNARGANAVDWQTSRSGASQVASGAQSVIGGGSNNTASQQFSAVSGGTANNAGAYLSYIGGGFSNTTSRDFAAVTSGYANTAAGFYNYIGGGYNNSANSNSAVTTQSATMNGTTAVTLSGSNANIKVGQLITGTSISTLPPTYVAAISGTSLTLSQAASGSSTSTLSFFTPHGVVVGGGNNQATGAYSFIGGGGDAGTAANRNVASGDWSTVGGGAKNVASGPASVIVGGGFLGTSIFGNTASADTTFVGGGILNVASNSGAVITGGWQNISNGILSTVGGGRYATARGISGINVFSTTAPIADNWGVSQSSLLIIGRQTTDATATRLTSDTAAASTVNQVILPNNSAYFFRGEVVSGVTGGGNTKGWTIEGVIKRGANAASTALVGTPTVTSMYADVGAATWTIALSADTTNGGLAVTFTGQAGTTIRTVARINTVEMTF